MNTAIGSSQVETLAPAVNLGAIGLGASLTGVATLQANPTDNVSVAGVQFLLDGPAAGRGRRDGPLHLFVGHQVRQ